MSYSSQQSWRVYLWVYAPVLLWLGVIFYLSSGSGSASETSRIIGPLIKFFFPSVEESTLQTIHGLIRKTAHVTEYAILAALAARVALASSVTWIRRFWPLLPFALVVATASADEYNQSFNPQRTGTPWDVLIDIAGGALALLIISIFKKSGSTPSSEELTTA
jgi:VanZ family protein